MKTRKPAGPAGAAKRNDLRNVLKESAKTQAARRKLKVKTKKGKKEKPMPFSLPPCIEGKPPTMPFSLPPCIEGKPPRKKARAK
jgi:hypothetical protein